MLNFKIGSFRVGISIWFAAFFAAILFFSRDKTLFLAMLALGIHEIGHLLIMFATGVHARGLFFLFGRLVIWQSRGMVRDRLQVPILIGGVLANIIASVGYLIGGNTEGCLINLLVAAYNLLPAGDLDGGALLLIVLEKRFMPRRAHAIHLAASVAISFILMAVGIFMLLRGYQNLTVLFSGIYLMVLNLRNLQYTK